MNLDFKQVQSEDDLKSCFTLIKSLREHLDFETFLEVYQQAKVENQYKLFQIFVGPELAAVIGYRILFDFVHAKHLYIDDLITAEKFRSMGIGAKILETAEKRARDLNCSGLRLCTGIENEGARKFYEKNGWQFRAVVYKKKLFAT